MTKALVLAMTLTLAACSGDRGDTNPTAATGPIYCKSPLTGEPVTKEVALTQARRHAARLKARALALGDTQAITIHVDCGDTTEVVFAPPTAPTAPTE
jgi:hypothetical protein